jgi:hypothetical protein
MGLEKKLEKRACDVARANGWWTRKFSSPANRGVPDRIFLKDGVVWFVEFKAPGNVPTKLQDHEIDQIRVHGGNVMWLDNIDEFKMLLGIYT